ncbi:MAG TPA: hypothetical protein VGU73_07310 [Acidimicrobiia bacterium]|nr:hypothetical protein [Acidimicrobiia bacterium]
MGGTGTLTPARAVTRTSLDRPAGVAALVVLGAVVFVAIRFAAAGGGDLSHFVMGTTRFVDPAHAPRSLGLVHGQTYDGIFYYRLALDPSNLHTTAFGIRIDLPFRFERIGYPFLAWLVSLGQAPLVPYSLVLVNLLALGAIGFLGATFARDARRHALWGLLLPGFFGLWFSVARDLTEPVSAACLLAALLAYRRGRFALAGGLFAYAALTRLAAFAWRRSAPGRADVAWTVPVLAFAAWQVVAWDATGTVPFSSNLKENAGSFLHPLVHAVSTNVRLLSVHHPDSDIWVVEVAVLAVFVGGAAWSLRTTTAPPHERVAFVAYAVQACFLSAYVYDDLSDLRTLVELYLFAVLVLLGTRRSLRPYAALLLVPLALAVGHRIVSL